MEDVREERVRAEETQDEHPDAAERKGISSGRATVRLLRSIDREAASIPIFPRHSTVI